MKNMMLHNRVGDITAHLNRTDPSLIASYIPQLDWGSASCRNYASALRGLNYEMRPTGTLTWGNNVAAGRCLTLTNGTDGKLLSKNLMASTAGERVRGCTLEFYTFIKTNSATARRLVSVTINNRNLGVIRNAANTMALVTVGVANLVITPATASTNMNNMIIHCIAASTLGSNASSYIYTKEMFVDVEVLTATSTGVNSAIANTGASISRIGLGDLTQTTQQENQDLMFFNFFNDFKPETWAKRRLGDPWGFLRENSHTRVYVPTIVPGQPFIKRQGGVVHTLNASRPFYQGYW